MPHGVSSICCVADHSKTSSRAIKDGKIQNVSRVPIEEIVNSDTYKRIRREMLAGIVPEACAGCKRVEDSGGTSKRMRDGSKYGLEHAKITEPDGTIKVDLLDVELRLGNYCNLKCRGCNAESSTSWIPDYHKLKNKISLPSSYDIVLKSPDTDYSWCESDEFYDKLLESATNMRHLHISGGEPFLVPKHFQLLDKLAERGQRNVRIHYITNLNYNFDKIRPALDRLKDFDFISISFSIDDVAERNSYIRSGSDWNLTMSNLSRFLTEYPEFYYTVTQTFNVYNFMYCEQLYLYLQSNKLLPHKFPHNGIVLNHIHAPDYFNANVLPREVRRAKLDSVAHILPEQFYNNLHGRYYDSEQNGKLETFLSVTDAMDEVRKENGRELFRSLWEKIK
jgi:sulfatase maturation enzyme AslB (radical SAM superfamily)